ncbi:U1 small nuclear ribonucleoprotein [Smittium mucronatum]|uniref:U1 small nuclear ribonucleoprotein n=1 Tax=Smittium mucronatum TaxID=133383 RepID=A0A1R0GU17_9FUNG|nr:U1 small nuclear ribonucleoprotein [Smittium mucronatum]
MAENNQAQIPLVPPPPPPEINMAQIPVQPVAHVAPEPFKMQPLPYIPGMPTKLPRQPPCTKPNKTIYINNLNEKTKIAGITFPPHFPSQKFTFFFSQTYGDILEIRANSSLYRKGQAFVTFSRLEDATKALKEAHGLILFGKPLMLQYARYDSYLTVVSEGKSLEEYKAEFKREKEKRDRELRASEGARKPTSSTPVAPSFNYVNVGGSVVALNVPNKILFIQQLPSDITKQELEIIFNRYGGFIEVRTVPGKSDIAFVEYDNEMSATAAKNSIGSEFSVRPDQPKSLLSYARR